MCSYLHMEKREKWREEKRRTGELQLVDMEPSLFSVR